MIQVFYKPVIFGKGIVTGIESIEDNSLALSKLVEDVVQADGGQDFTNDQSMGNNKLTNLASGTDFNDAITKNQLDQAQVALPVVSDVLGVQTDATLDPGATPTLGDRYILTDTGNLHANFGSPAGVGDNDIVEYNGSVFIVSQDVSALAMGLLTWDQGNNEWQHWDEVSWSYHGGLTGVTAGEALSKTGNILDVNVDDTGIEVSSDALQLKDAGITSTKLAAALNTLINNKITNTGAEIYAADTGAVDAYVITLSPVPTSYTNGMPIVFKASNANAGASTIDVNSLGVEAIKREDGNDIYPEDILANEIVFLVYDGTNFVLKSARSLNRQSLNNLISNSRFGLCSKSTPENIETQITLTDVTSGVCLTTNTQNLIVGKLFKFNSGDFNTETFVITSITTNVSFTISDTSKTDSGSPGTGYEITPGFVAGDDKSFDGWTKTTGLDLYREHQGSNTKNGSFYACKAVNTSGSTQYLIWNGSNSTELSYLRKFYDKTIACALWVKANGASKVRIVKYEDGYVNLSTQNIGTSYEWLEGFVTLGNSASDVRPFVIEIQDNTTVYLSQPTLVFGSSIGEGNYPQALTEEILLVKPVQLNFSFDTISSDISYNLEAVSNGIIPKGITKIDINGYAQSTNSQKYLAFVPSDNNLFVDGVTVYTVNALNFQHSLEGSVRVANDETLKVLRNDTFVMGRLLVKSVVI